MRIKYKKLIFMVHVSVVALVMSTAAADMVAYYPFNEGNGRIIKDIYGGHDGSMVGEVQWIESKSGYGTALYFSGANGSGHVKCGTWNPSENTGQLSVAFWIKWDGDGNDWQGVIVKRNNWEEDDMMWQIEVNKQSEQINFKQEACEPMHGDFILPKGIWTHVAITFDGTTEVSYINGEMNSKDNFSFGQNLDSWILIGASGTDGTNTFHGAIDDVCIFDTAISKEDVVQLYKMGGKSFVSIPLLTMVDSVRQAKNNIEKRTPQESIEFFEKKIAEYELWKKENPKFIGTRSESLASDLHFLLAKAKKNANATVREIAESYMKTALESSQSENYIPALIWLFNNLPKDDYLKFARQCVAKDQRLLDNIHLITKDFESRKSWEAFKYFLDALFSEASDSNSFANAISKSMNNDSLWKSNFLDYCRNKPVLAEYVVNLCEEMVQDYKQKGKYLKAAEKYRDMSEQSTNEKDRMLYELRACECIFESGKCNMTLGELNALIENKKISGYICNARAMLLKGHVHIQLGELDKALNIFSEIITEYPDGNESLEASFFIGYCNKLDGKYEEAKKKFDLLIKKYPQSPYASKARLCIRLIEGIKK